MWVAIALAIAVVVAIVIWRIVLLIPGAAVATAEAGAVPPFAFELAYVTTVERSYRLAAKIRLHGSGSSGFSHMGILCQYKVTIGGEVWMEELVGVGGDLPRSPQRRIEKGYMMADTRNSGQYSHSSIRVLTPIPSCPAGTEIVVQGHFEPKLGTESSLLIVFLGR